MHATIMQRKLSQSSFGASAIGHPTPKTLAAFGDRLPRELTLLASQHLQERSLADDRDPRVALIKTFRFDLLGTLSAQTV